MGLPEDDGNEHWSVLVQYLICDLVYIKLGIFFGS